MHPPSGHHRLPVLAVLACALLLLISCTKAAPVAALTLTPLSYTPSAGTPTATPQGATPKPQPYVPPEVRSQVEKISQEVSALRGFTLAKLPEPKFLTRQELQDRYRRDLEADKGDLQVLEDVLKMFGALAPTDDLAKTEADLRGGSVLGFFDPSSGELVIIGQQEKFSGLGELTYAHEFTHALQQDKFDIIKLSREREGDSEAQAGLTALLEGDATLSMYQYIYKHYTQLEVLGFSSGDAGPVQAKAPPFLVSSLLFPYREGLAFVSSLYGEGGWARVDKAYANPPVSTEQIMHPEKYRLGEKPMPVVLPDLVAAMGAGWSVRHEDSIGERDLRSLLETGIGTLQAGGAAEGWGGDKFVLMGGPGGEKLIVASMAWDSGAEAQEFFRAFTDWQTAKGKTLQKTQDKISWDASSLRIQGSKTLLVLAESKDAAGKAQAAFPKGEWPA